FIVGYDSDGPAADSRVPANQRFAVLRAILFKFTAVNDARDHLPHVVLAGWIRRKNAVDFFRWIRGMFRFLVVKSSGEWMSHFIDECANASQAGFIVRFAKIHSAADFRMHFRSAEIFCPIAACTSAGPARKRPEPSVIRM